MLEIESWPAEEWFAESDHFYLLETDELTEAAQRVAAEHGVVLSGDVEHWAEHYVDGVLCGYDPENVWAVYVGSQTPEEFVTTSPRQPLERALQDYVADTTQLGPRGRAALVTLLLRASESSL